MDVIVRLADDGVGWALTDLLGRSMGRIVEDPADTFVVRPHGNATETMRGMRLGPFGSLDLALAAIETHTRGICRRDDGPPPVMMEEASMPKGEQRGNKEAKKPKKEKPKTIAAAPSQKGSTQPLPPMKPSK